MKNIIFFIALLAISLAGKAQIEFGPYLTYSGRNPDTYGNQMTIQVGINRNNSKDYYVVYWRQYSSTIYIEKLSTERIINTMGCGQVFTNTTNPLCLEIQRDADLYHIYSEKLEQLVSGAKYYYFITTNKDYFENSKARTSAYIYNSNFDAASGKPLIASNDSKISGEIDGTGNNLVISKGLKAELSDVKISGGSSIKFTINDSPIYSFTTPDNSDTIVSFSLISDTQPQTWWGELCKYQNAG